MAFVMVQTSKSQEWVTMSQSHCHHHGKNTSLRVLTISIILLLIFAIIEAIGGWWAHSLALLGDAGHMASDAIALAIAAFATWFAKKPPSEQHSYGFARAEIIAAWCSSLLLLAISIAVIVEAIVRIEYPPKHIHGSTVMLVASIGIFVNLTVAWLLSRGERNLNMKAALLHVLSDLLASFAALLSGAVIYYTNSLLVDPILSILIGIMIMVSSIRLLRESMLILMEGVPRNIDYAAVAQSLRAMPGVRNIHDLHIWSLSSGRAALSAHIDIHELSQWQTLLIQIRDMLNETYHINHITLQPEPDVFDCQPCEEH